MQEAGRYRLTRRLGQGGMAEVFEGVAEGAQGFRRRVAIKRVLPHLAADAGCARMFLDEARIASHLHHVGIVSVLDYGTIDGLAFQALEFVDGMDLDQVLRKAEELGFALDPGLALHIVMQVAGALDHAHEARDDQGQPLGIVHRDVSASNVLLSWDGHVKLSDFGIALSTDRQERTEGAGIKGKLEYMAPEQALRGNIDRRTDVFALGCLLHRALCGRSPLSDFGVLAKMTAGEELTIDDTIDPDIREVIAHATRSAQVQRYASAKEVVAALRVLLPRYLRDDPTLALKAWLERVKAGAETVIPKRGALDQLLDIQLVLSESTMAGERTFKAEGLAVSAQSEADALAREVSPIATTAHKELFIPPNSAPKTKRVLLLSASSIVAVALVVSVALMSRALGPHAESARWPTPPLPALPAQTPPLLTTSAETTGLQAAKEVEPREVATRSAKAQLTKPGRKRDLMKAETPIDPPQLAPSVGKGTLVVGGDGALRAEIRVDGQSMGYAPKRLELSVGEHEVELVGAAGSAIGKRRLAIEARHTQSAPLRFIVP